MLQKLFIFPLILGISLTTTSVWAESIELPDYAIGVSEADFNSLRNDYLCSVTYHPGSEIVTNCGGVADTMFNSFPFNSGTVVVARTESTGAMYTVSNETVEESGRLVVRRYLPNGFYQVGKKYYWIVGNKKIRLTKATAYEHIASVAMADLFEPLADGQVIREGVIPMSSSDFTSLTESGSVLRGRFRGEVVMNVDAGGVLYYLPLRMDLSPRPITSEMTKAETWHLVQRFSRNVKPSLMQKLDTLTY